MKLTVKTAISIVTVGLAFALGGNSGTALADRVIVSPPVPTPMVVPSSYVWDGAEYVGMVGNQYYYLGPGNVWIVMDTGRRNHFRTWEKGHPDWSSHSTRNVRYHKMGPANHPQPVRTSPAHSPDQTPQRQPRSGQHNPGGQ